MIMQLYTFLFSPLTVTFFEYTESCTKKCTGVKNQDIVHNYAYLCIVQGDYFGGLETIAIYTRTGDLWRGESIGVG